MKYVGSKGRHAREILPIILDGRKEGQTYVEPFVGGANTLQHVTGPRLAGDLHPHLIAMWQEASEGWMPPAPSLMDECAYKECKAIKGSSIAWRDRKLMAFVAFMGFSLSYGGKWFGGYRRDKSGKRNYAAEALRAAEKEFPKVRGVEFVCGSYDTMTIPPESIIYCDPPYADTLGYATGEFDHAKFWQWVRVQVAAGHKVFVSEYSAPDDFEAVWHKRVNNTLAADTGEKGATERLWVHVSQI